MEGEVLRLLGEGEVADTWVLAQSKGWDHLALVGVVKSLSTDFFATTSDLQIKFYTFTEEADACLSAGMSPELALLTAVSEGGMPMAEARANKARGSRARDPAAAPRSACADAVGRRGTAGRAACARAPPASPPPPAASSLSHPAVP